MLFDGKQAGNYDFYTLTETAANVMAFQLNLNHPDPIKNKLFNTKEFRQALSVSVDRQALIDAVFVSQGTPAQASIREGDPLYNERLAKQWTEYDPDKASTMLDALLPNRDGDGWRLDESGKRFTLVFELDQTRTTFIDMFQLVIPMFQAVGIDAQVRSMDRSLWETRVRQSLDFDATAHQFGANSGIAAMLDARYFRADHCHELAVRARLVALLLRSHRSGSDRAAGRREGPAGPLPQAARLGRPGRAEHADGPAAGERRRPVLHLRRQPAARQLRRGAEQHGQRPDHHAQLLRLADPGPARPEQFAKT